MTSRLSLQVRWGGKWVTLDTSNRPNDLADASRTLHPGMLARIVEHQDVMIRQWEVPE